jgi:hypothetical protein
VQKIALNQSILRQHVEVGLPRYKINTETLILVECPGLKPNTPSLLKHLNDHWYD